MQDKVIIIGAGPAGLSLACSLAAAGIRVLVIEKRSLEDLKNPAIDGRDIALTRNSVRILQGLGAWPRIAPGAVAPIREARVLDGNSPYSMDIASHRSAGAALGYLVANHDIRTALFRTLRSLATAELVTGAGVTAVSSDRNGATVRLANGASCEAALVAAADSRFSGTRRMMGISATLHDFGRVAIVCRMEHEQPHHGIAWECFQYARTLAVLPLSARLSSIVITVSAETADTILEMSEAEFNRDVRERFGNRLGTMRLVGRRYAWPLVAVHAERFTANRFALVGDAAVGMHPVTAHGFNLGLRGQDILAGLIKTARSVGRDIGSRELLDLYQSRHMRVTRPLYTGTNGIVTLFTNDTRPARILRKLVLRFGNHFPPVRRFITDQLTEDHSTGKLHLPFP